MRCISETHRNTTYWILLQHLSKPFTNINYKRSQSNSLDCQENILLTYYIFIFPFYHLDLDVLRRGFELLKILSKMNGLKVHFTVFYLLI